MQEVNRKCPWNFSPKLQEKRPCQGTWLVYPYVPAMLVARKASLVRNWQNLQQPSTCYNMLWSEDCCRQHLLLLNYAPDWCAHAALQQAITIAGREGRALPASYSLQLWSSLTSLWMGLWKPAELASPGYVSKIQQDLFTKVDTRPSPSDAHS